MAERLCVCRKPLTEDGDCSDSACVGSARLPLSSEDASGTYRVDGSYSARTAGGVLHGQMRVTHIDPEWSRAMMEMLKLPAGDVSVD